MSGNHYVIALLASPGITVPRRWTWPAGAVLGLLLLLTGCAGIPDAPIPQAQSDTGAIGFQATFRAPLGAPAYEAKGLYLAEVRDGRTAPEDRVIAAAVARDGRVYALGIPPGDYAVFAVLTRAPGILDDGSVYVAFLGEPDIARTVTTVNAGGFVFAGAIDVDTDLFVCPENSDPTQQRLSKLLFPDRPLCGWMAMIMGAAREGVVIGGQVYPTGAIVYPYRGRLRSLGLDEETRVRFLRNAATDLSGTGWAERLPVDAPP